MSGRIGRREFGLGVVAAALCGAAYGQSGVPARIVSTAPSSTEALFALGLGRNVVGVSIYCEYPPEVKALPKVGTYVKPDVEAIARLRPDLVVLQRHEGTITGRLQALGIRYVEMPYGSLADVYTGIAALAAAAGVAARGRDLNGQIQTGLAGVKARSAGKGKVKVLVVADRRGGALVDMIAVGPGNYVNEMIEIAGGVNVLRPENMPMYPHISLETVVRFDPEVIVDLTDSHDMDAAHARAREEDLRLWGQHTELAAVRAGKVIVGTSVALLVPGPRTPEAAEMFYGYFHGGAGLRALLELEGVGFRYGSREVLGSVSFEAGAGEFVAVLGSNGAGKSTLLDLVSGYKVAGAGRILVGGRAVAEYGARELAKRVSHLPQAVHADLPFTAEQLVAMGRYPHTDRWFESEEDHRLVRAAMERTKAWEWRGRGFATLSGGERQRVLLAACLAQAAEILLLDEPSTFLDIAQQLECFSMLREEADEGRLCVAVTHDLNLAMRFCTRLVVLAGGGVARDMGVEEAAGDEEWLGLFSGRLRMGEAEAGTPWVWYR